MKYTTTLFTGILFFLGANGQSFFFKSDNSFVKDKSNFYSSVRIHGDLLLYNADDYNLYVYDKNTMTLKWTYYLGWKSNKAPFIINSEVWCQTNRNEMIRLDTATGKLLKPLYMSSVDSEPLVKNNTAYFTGIYDLGRIFAYDLAGDSVLWSKFIAHGCSVQPFYLKDKMIVNAEGDNWIELDYNGKFVEKKCENEEYHFPSELSCVKKFTLLTHDNKELSPSLAEELIEDLDNYDVAKNSSSTLLLTDSKLIILGNKLKIKDRIDIQSLNDTLEVDEYAYRKILSATEESVTFIHSGYLFEYDIKKKRTLRTIDLSAYDVSQAVMEVDKLWLVSKKDKVLYGLNL